MEFNHPYLGHMKPNIRPTVWEGVPAFEVLDFTLFMYGLVRGDIFRAGTEGKPIYAELGVYGLDGAFRLGIPYFEERGWVTRLSGLVTASRSEFSISPDRASDLTFHGRVSEVLQSAFRGRRRS